MLKAFEAFLLQKESIKPQYLFYYLKWVSDCYAFLNAPLSDRLSRCQREQFLMVMAKRYDDWQVKQADAALSLYDYFLSRQITDSRQSAPSGALKAIEERMREALRLRHRSLSTTTSRRR